MQHEEIRRSLSVVCGQSTLLRKGLFNLMNWLTGRSWHVRRELKKWLRSAPDRAHVLDAGAGFGQNSWWLSCQREKFSVLAVDNAQERVCSGNAFVRDTNRKNLLFRTLNLEALEDTDAFDLILCTETLEYVNDDDKVIGNFHHALHQGGMVIGTVNRCYEGKKLERDAMCRHGYTREDLKAKFKSAGFSKVKTHYTLGSSGRLAGKIGLEIPLKMLKLTRLLAVVLPFYYIFAFPVTIVLNWIDSHMAHLNGNGIIVLAWK
ncbi:MAG: methyltransferase domain-containing protein [Cryomorphaceae bacterium]|nr:methyltransferase domain-containing protein [Cryomorphaceae bacterium]